MSSLLKHFGLIIKYGKSEVFHFFRSHVSFNPPLLNLSHFGGQLLTPKDIWKYLGFHFQ